MGKLIVIDGLDGSGKETQSNLLTNILNKKYIVKRISFPNYKSWSSTLVKNYLEGELGDDISKISPYAIHSFYASDRYISYINEWKQFYELKNSIIIADRYTTSSILYQSVNMNKDDMIAFGKYVEDYEYNKLGLPRPDKVIFLSVSPSLSQKSMSNRGLKGNLNNDIHEAKPNMMNELFNNSKILSEYFNWNVIKCDDSDNFIDILTITDKIVKTIQL